LEGIFFKKHQISLEKLDEMGATEASKMTIPDTLPVVLLQRERQPEENRSKRASFGIHPNSYFFQTW